MSLTSLVSHHAARFPDRPALEYQGLVTSWSDLLDATQRIAGALRDLGVGRGDVVATLMHNSDRFLELMHAASHLGAVFLPINWRLAAAEVEHVLGHAGAVVAIVDPAPEQLTSTASAYRVVRAFGAGDSDRVSLDELLERAGPELEPAAVSPADLHRLMYTSGTTSRPKSMMLSYANLNAKNASHLVEFGMSADCVKLACGPLYHVGALDLTTSTLMYAGATTHILRHFSAAAVVDAIEQHRVTDVWLAPVMIRLLLDEPDPARRDLGSVRLIIDGGEKMSLALIDRVLEAFPNAWFADAYGLTETVAGDGTRQATNAREARIGRAPRAAA